MKRFLINFISIYIGLVSVELCGLFIDYIDNGIFIFNKKLLINPIEYSVIVAIILFCIEKTLFKK